MICSKTNNPNQEKKPKRNTQTQFPINVYGHKNRISQNVMRLERANTTNS